MVKKVKNGGNADRWGAKNPNSKLDEQKVAKIRKLHRAGMIQNKIAEHFKVHPSTISDIVIGKSWPETN